jgi:hypothetical protein
MTGGKFKLTKAYRETIAAAKEYAEAKGANVSFELSGRHPKIIVERDGLVASSPFASTPRTSEHWNHGKRSARQAIAKLDAASVDTHPKGQDAKQGLAGTEGSAVLSDSEADAQNPPNNIYSGHDLK